MSYGKRSSRAAATPSHGRSGSYVAARAALCIAPVGVRGLAPTIEALAPPPTIAGAKNRDKELRYVKADELRRHRGTGENIRTPSRPPAFYGQQFWQNDGSSCELFRLPASAFGVYDRSRLVREHISTYWTDPQ